MTEKRRKWLVVALALAAAVAFAWSVGTGMWWSVGEVTIGPFGTHHCFGGECRGSGLSWIVGATDTWMRSAAAAGVAGLIAMLVLIEVASMTAASVERVRARMAVGAVHAFVSAAYFVFAFADTPGPHVDRWLAGLGAAVACALVALPRVGTRVALVMIATALAAAAYFVVAFPGVPGAHVDVGMIVYGIACASGIAACALALRAGQR